MTSPYERLLAEALPTGTFGHAQPPRPGPRPWTALEQAEHHAVLAEAISGWEYDRDTRQTDRRHLRLIDTEQPIAA